MPIQSLSIAPASDDSGRIVSNPEATGNLKDRHADYTASRTSSILNGRANQFGWLQAPPTDKSFPSTTSANPATIRIDNFRV